MPPGTGVAGAVAAPIVGIAAGGRAWVAVGEGMAGFIAVVPDMLEDGGAGIAAAVRNSGTSARVWVQSPPTVGSGVKRTDWPGPNLGAVLELAELDGD
jgi:hypothetical protein